MGNTNTTEEEGDNIKSVKFGGFSIKFDKNKKLTEQLSLFENIINTQLEDIHQLILKDKKNEEIDKIIEKEKKDEVDDKEDKKENEIKTDKKFQPNKNISNEIQNLNFGTEEFNKAFQNKMNLIKDTKSEIIKYIKVNK